MATTYYRINDYSSQVLKVTDDVYGMTVKCLPKDSVPRGAVLKAPEDFTLLFLAGQRRVLGEVYVNFVLAVLGEVDHESDTDH